MMASNFTVLSNTPNSGVPTGQSWQPPSGGQPWAPPGGQSSNPGGQSSGGQPWQPPNAPPSGGQPSNPGSQPWAPPGGQPSNPGSQQWAPPSNPSNPSGQPWAPPSNPSNPGSQPWTQQSGGITIGVSTPKTENRTGLEILGDNIVDIFDKYVKLQCLPHLVEGLQKEGLNVSTEKLESLLPQKSTLARQTLLSGNVKPAGPSDNFSTPSFGTPNMGQQMFNSPQAGAFNPGGFMPPGSASTADKNAQEKAKLADPNFNDNYKPGGCLSYPTRGAEGKYRFCGNPVSNQYTIVCEKCRSTRAAARELDSEFTQKLSRREQFNFEEYRRNVSQKRLDYARGAKSGGKKGGNNFTTPSFGFNPMDNSFNPMGGMQNQMGGMPPGGQPMQGVNNGPPRVCNKYVGIIPDELAQFNTPEYGIPVFFKNHRLMAMLKDTGNGSEQQVLVLAGCDTKEGPLRKTTPDDWNMIKISDLKFTGPYVINYDLQQGQPQNNPWNTQPGQPQGQFQGQPQNNPWNTQPTQPTQPQGQFQGQPQNNPWNTQPTQPTQPQGQFQGQPQNNPWNTQPGQPQGQFQGQPQNNPWNTQPTQPGQLQGQLQGQPQNAPWNTQPTQPGQPQGQLQGQHQNAPWNTQPTQPGQPQGQFQGQPQNAPWNTQPTQTQGQPTQSNESQPPQPAQPQGQPTQPQGIPWNTQPAQPQGQPTQPSQPQGQPTQPSQPQGVPWNTQPTQPPQSNESQPPQEQSNVQVPTPNTNSVESGSTSFDAIIANIVSPKTNTPNGSMKVQEF